MSKLITKDDVEALTRENVSRVAALVNNETEEDLCSYLDQADLRDEGILYLITDRKIWIWRYPRGAGYSLDTLREAIVRHWNGY